MLYQIQHNNIMDSLEKNDSNENLNSYIYPYSSNQNQISTTRYTSQNHINTSYIHHNEVSQSYSNTPGCRINVSIHNSSYHLPTQLPLPSSISSSLGQDPHRLGTRASHRSEEEFKSTLPICDYGFPVDAFGSSIPSIRDSRQCLPSIRDLGVKMESKKMDIPYQQNVYPNSFRISANSDKFSANTLYMPPRIENVSSRKMGLDSLLNSSQSVREEPLPLQELLRPKATSRKTSKGKCNVEGCKKLAQLKGKCQMHGGAVACRIQNCENLAVTRGVCISHGGGRRCAIDGCLRGAKNNGLCWRHGKQEPKIIVALLMHQKYAGGRVQCEVEGCTKGGKIRNRCWAHGGGKKCKVEGCEKNALTKGHCWGHGGGKRCIVQGCGKHAYERNKNYCSKHAIEFLGKCK